MRIDALGAIAPQRPPLLVEGKLQRAANLQVVGQFLASFLQGLRARDAPDPAATRSSSPVCTAPAARRTKRNRRATSAFASRNRSKRARASLGPDAKSSAPPQTAAASSVAKTWSYSTGAERRTARSVLRCIELCAVDPAMIRQPLQADQQRISGEGRRGRVRRVAVAERAQRQNLPQALAGRS